MVGAHYVSGKAEFTVWAPFRNNVSLILYRNNRESFGMKKDRDGYWRTSVERIESGVRYEYLLDEKIERSDPASNSQPEGVHGPSAIVDHDLHCWRDKAWQGMRFEDMVFYELHVGVFTLEGTFASAARRLDELADLGVNAVEIMPIAQFVGNRNWGYDGVYPYAVQNTYGGPEGLKDFVNECHTRGIAVILDIVLNHLGLEGNYLSDFGPYFTEEHQTPWGPAVNYDGDLSAHVRNYFLNCVLHWIENYHVDGLRLDAVHAIFDKGPKHFLQELAEVVRQQSMATSRKICLIAESDLNDSKIVRSIDTGGFGVDAQWLDDFHHSLHALLTGERTGYYVDFGSMQNLLKALVNGYVYSGEYSSFRRKTHGNSSSDIPPSRFVAFSQNHDQVGNRRGGERLISLAGLEAAKLAAGIVILSPYLPLLFMGEEYGEDAPFLFFTSYAEQNLVEAAQRGRRAEFAQFKWQTEPPNPQSMDTFEKSKINWAKRHLEGRKILDYYRNLIHMRAIIPAFRNPNRKEMQSFSSKDGSILFVNRWKQTSEACVIANFSKNEQAYSFPFEGGTFQKILDSASVDWKGPGSKVPTKAVYGDTHVMSGLSLTVFTNSKVNGSG